MIRGTSSAERFDIYEPAKALWFGYMKDVVCNEDDLISSTLEGRKLRGDLIQAF